MLIESGGQNGRYEDRLPRQATRYALRERRVIVHPGEEWEIEFGRG
jgi:hypothetical protein